MLQKNTSKFWHLKLLNSVALCGAIVVSGNPISAQVTPDNSLGVERSIVTSGTSNSSLHQQVEGGAIRGINLFHSFHDFNIPEGQSLYFQNPIGIRNIISRVTGGSSSNINGTLGVLGGNANLFLLNPSGIVLGTNARLDVGGSFVATTATTIQFGNQGFFSSFAPDIPPLLTVNPSAFLFNQVASASIINRSTVSSASNRQGLQVPDGQSLLLLGGEINLAGGGMNAAGGRVELGAVAGIGAVGLSIDNNNLRLSFPVMLDRANVLLTNGATVDTTSEGGGPIQIWGKRVLVNGGSKIAAFTEGTKPGGNLIVNASESVELLGFSPPGNLSTLTFGDGKAGDLTINTRKLIVRDGAQVLSATLSNGSAGQLTVNASESVELTGLPLNSFIVTGLGSFTGGSGDAGSLTINTTRLIVQNRAVLSTESLSIGGGNGQLIPVSGQGGNLTINAAESVELSNRGFIYTIAQGPEDAGNLTINTAKLSVQDRSEINAQNIGSGDAGNIIVRARSIELKNQSQIDAETTASQGGNITLQVADLLLLRQGSSISTNAGTAQAGGDGGNIIFNGNFIVAVDNEDSDITANAFTGRGGNVEITAQSLFGIQFRPALTPLSDITASSAFGAPGVVTIATPDVDPNRGLVQLPVDVTDASRLIVQTCPTGDGIAKQPNEFIITKRGGLPPTPSEAVNQDAIQVGLVTAEVEDTSSTSRHESDQKRSSSSLESPIVEAQSLQVATDGTLFLVAVAPQSAISTLRNPKGTAPLLDSVHCH